MPAEDVLFTSSSERVGDSESGAVSFSPPPTPELASRRRGGRNGAFDSEPGNCKDRPDGAALAGCGSRGSDAEAGSASCLSVDRIGCEGLLCVSKAGNRGGNPGLSEGSSLACCLSDMSLGTGLEGRVAFLFTEGGGNGGCAIERREVPAALGLFETLSSLVSTDFDTDDERAGGGSM